MMVTNSLHYTKIVATLGPSSSTPEMIEKLIDSGVDVFRLNFSHGDHETHLQNINNIRKISSEKQKNIAILQDLQGPKIRTGKLFNGGLSLESGQEITFIYGTEQKENNVIPIDYEHLAQDVHVGAKILLDDGLLSMEIKKMEGHEVFCQVTHGGYLKSRKGVNFPGCRLSIPSTTEKDTKDMLFGIAHHVDYMALSFVQSAQDVLKFKDMLRALGAQIPVITKVEMLGAVEQIEQICQISDGIMVARGDLGVECGFAHVAVFQKKIIEASLKFGKPVIVATQMLDSMIENRRPTKAEICDVANAVFDRADATMLSGETASGKYPDLAVKTMRDILTRIDDNLNQALVSDGLMMQRLYDENNFQDVFASTTTELADKLNAKAIVCLTLTGTIAKHLAKFRSKTPIIAFSPRPDIARRMSLYRGILGIHNNTFYDTDQAFNHIAEFVKTQGFVAPGDVIVITGGIPVSAMKSTNTLKIHRVS